jgi:Trk-type K+ transport system membrane component
LNTKGSGRDAFSCHNPNRWTAGHTLFRDDDSPWTGGAYLPGRRGAGIYPDLLCRAGDRLLLWWPNRRQKGELKSREGFLIVVLFWTVLGSVGSLPFIFSEQPNLSITDAFFESFSGLTTTGATTLVGLDSLPHAILFYRQMLQWFGGMGIIVLAVASCRFWASGDAALSRRNARAAER